MNKSSLIQSVAIAAVVAVMAGSTVQEAKAWPWVNPQIADSGKQVTGAYYDPFAGRVVIRTDRQRVRESFLDPNRGFVDPGSKHWVDRQETDAQGRTWRVRGWQWTSNGVPHGNVKRTRISGTGIPGVDHHETDRVAYSYRPGNNAQPGASVGSEPGPAPQRREVRRPQQWQQRPFRPQPQINRNRINHLFD